MPDPSLIGPVLLSPWIFVQKHTRLYALVPTYSLFATDGGSGRDAGGFGTRMDAADYGFLAYGYTFGRDGGCGSSAPVFVFASVSVSAPERRIDLYLEGVLGEMMLVVMGELLEPHY